MIKDIYDYFENLDKKNLPRNEHSIIMDNDRIKHLSTKLFATKYGKPNLQIDDTQYYAKYLQRKLPILDFATAEMYNSIGIPTLPCYSLQKDPEDTRFHTEFQLITQNIHSVKDFVFQIASTVIKSKDIIEYRLKAQDNWDIFYDEELRELFLKYMTPDCLDALCGLFLIDELRTETDRHADNYFFYKGPNDRKFKGIIPIDNELGEILTTDTTPATAQEFNDFLKSTYSLYSPLGDFKTPQNYQTRINKIKELIDDYALSPNQIALLKRALEYDFPQAIKTAGEHPYLKQDQQSAYDAMSRLWEYNRQELGTEL